MKSIPVPEPDIRVNAIKVVSFHLLSLNVDGRCKVSDNLVDSPLRDCDGSSDSVSCTAGVFRDKM